jgi:hypothetical protein
VTTATLAPLLMIDEPGSVEVRHPKPYRVETFNGSNLPDPFPRAELCRTALPALRCGCGERRIIVEWVGPGRLALRTPLPGWPGVLSLELPESVYGRLGVFHVAAEQLERQAAAAACLICFLTPGDCPHHPERRR